MRSLPSLNALRAFEACARRLSLTAAARELCVTHSAVSHQIRQLEAWFGQPLFLRHAGGVRLTPSGEILQQAASQALSQLEQTCDQLRQQARHRELVIGAPGSFLANWLIPRMEDLERAEPEIMLRLQTRNQAEALLRGDVDLLIVGSQQVLPAGLRVEALVGERIGPVCAPGWRPMPEQAATLATLPRLHTRSHPQAWADWANVSQLDPASLLAGRHFDTLSLMLEAAASGLGFAMAPELLVAAEVRRGRLVAPLGFVQTEHSVVCAVLAERALESPLAKLVVWLCQQARGGMGEPTPVGGEPV